jgi:hypothetical protein
MGTFLRKITYGEANKDDVFLQAISFSNSSIMKKYVFLPCFVFISSFLLAQSTETFETEASASASFTDNGQVFNITSQARGPFDIETAFPGTGWNGTSADNRYIDNDGNAGTGFTVGFTISSAGSVPFKLNSMYMFFSNAASLNQSVPGSLTLVGKLGGVTKFTATASSGFVTSLSTNNGFTFINMSTFGGSNNANMLIDQVVITTGGQYEYVALDAFNWTASTVLSAAASQTNIACYGGTGFASVSVSGGVPGYTYSWTPTGGTGATSNALVAGNYTCTITDAAMSTLTKTFSITQPAQVPVGITASPASAVICRGASVTLSGTGASTYTWTGGVVNNAAFNPTTTATYTVTGTNASACTNTAVITVTVNALPLIAVNSGSICSGQSFSLSPTGASTYTYSGGTALVSPTATTSYSVTGTSTGGCVSAVTAVSTITVNALPVIAASNGIICTGGSFTIAPTGANTYTYSSGSNVVSPSVTSSYSVTGTSLQGCTGNTAVVTVSVQTSLTVSISGSLTVCAGKSVTLTANGAGTYTWSTGATTSTISSVPAGNTTYTVNAGSGTCSGSAIVTVTVNPLPVVAATSNNTVLCTGNSSTLTATGATSYTWNTGATTTAITVSPTVTTAYTVTGTGTNGCTNTAMLTQTVNLCTGIATLHEATAAVVNVYPNPNSGVFYIELSSASQVYVINALGQVITDDFMVAGKHKVDIHEQAAGLYVVKVIQNGKQHLARLIKN